MTKMEQYEAIRRDQRLEQLSIRELARKHNVHRRNVREALDSAVPPKRKPSQRLEPVFGPWNAIVTGWLVADLTAPRKQRHSARRVWQRLVDEHGAAVSETTVRRQVGVIKDQLDRNVANVPIGQDHELGQEAEVDFGEVVVIIAGEQIKLNMFVMRLSASGKAFHFIYRTCDSAAFLDGHVRAFTYFGGVPRRIRYDNLKPAVIKVLIARKRIENERFIALRSHYGFDSFYCLPGIDGAHEKGGVEGEIGRFRRRWMVPVPQVEFLVLLNEIVAVADAAEDKRHIDGRIRTIGENFVDEAALLGEVPSEVFETGTLCSARVDTKARIMVLQCRYSVPVRLVGKHVDVLVRADELIISCANVVVATHERITRRNTESLILDHYLETLAAKPGALAGSSALSQARSTGAFSDTHQQFWKQARRKDGDKAGTKALIEVLLLHRNNSSVDIIAGMKAAMSMSNFDPVIVGIETRRHKDGVGSNGPLACVVPIAAPSCEQRSAPKLSAYDELLEVAK